jgi:hypothetical protein
MRWAAVALSAALLVLPLRSGHGATPAFAPPLHFTIDLPPYGNAFLRADDIAVHPVRWSGPGVQPFEAAGVRDESDAAQLWSTVFLALRPVSASLRR